jgi:hypothetical protein
MQMTVLNPLDRLSTDGHLTNEHGWKGGTHICLAIDSCPHNLQLSLCVCRCERATELDVLLGNDRWKQDPRSRFYDYTGLQERLAQLKEARRSGADWNDRMALIRENLDRNICGIGEPWLYLHATVGTKQLIQDYVAELALHINRDLLEAPESAVPRARKVHTPTPADLTCSQQQTPPPPSPLPISRAHNNIERCTPPTPVGLMCSQQQNRTCASLTHPYTHSPTHLLTHAPIHPLTHLPTHPSTQPAS